MSGFSPRTDPFPIEQGGQPNWIAGYVPPAAEWNHWWSVKADYDDPRIGGGPFLSLTGGTMTGELVLYGPPVNALDAATKAYVDQFTPVTGPYLPLSGGIMTGILTLASNPVGPMDATPRQYVDSVANTANAGYAVAVGAVPLTGGTMSGPLILYGNPSAPLGAATKQYVDQFLPLSGGTINGNLNVTGQISTTNLYAANVFYANSFNNWEWSFGVDANGDKIQSYRSGWYDQWSGTDGTRYWVGSSTVLMALDGSGNLGARGNFSCGNFTASGNANVTGTITGSGNITASGAMFTTNGVYFDWPTNDMFAVTDSVNHYVNFAQGFYLTLVMSTGNYVFQNPYGSMLVLRYGDSFMFNNQGAVGGVGAYRNISDDRTKTNLGPVTYGLADILRLEPSRFTRKPRGDKGAAQHPEIGLSAQQVRAVIPEAVIPVGIELDDGTGGLSSDHPTLAIAYDMITTTLVAAVKQLSQKLDAIDQRISAAMRA